MSNYPIGIGSPTDLTLRRLLLDDLVFLREGFRRILNGLQGSLWTFPADDVELLVLKFVGGNEKLLELFPDRL